MDTAAFPLMRHFLLWSIVTTGLVALLLSFASAGEMEQDLLAKDRRYARLLANVIRVQLEEHVLPWLEREEHEFRPGDAEQMRRIDEVLRYNTRHLGVLRVNFFDGDGRIVFSTERGRIGERQTGSPSLARALQGDAVTKLVASAAESHEPGSSAPPFLESYLPVRLELPGCSIRVFEIYQQGEDNLAAVRASKRRLSVAAVGAMLLLFLGNLYIVWRGSRAIEDERRNSTHYLDEARDLNEKLGALTRDLEKKVDRAARELAAADRLAAVGTLAAGMAHEVNTPLASISTCAEGLLRRSGSLEERDRKYLETIRDEAFRCKRITRQLLDFARPGQQDEGAEADLRDLVERTIRLLEFELQQKGVQLSVEGPGIRVRASADELEQVLLNLIRNSLDAVGPGGLIDLRIRAAAGGRAVLIIDDNGPGVPDDRLDRLLEPFYTTKEPGKGTGLGLSVSYGIVKRHGGELRFENRPEGGLRASVSLPRASFVPADEIDQS